MKNIVFFNQAKLLVQLLPQINKEKVFAIKGGTAINYFYRNLPRLSVDIDIAFLPVKPRDDSIQDISAALNRIIEGIKYTISDVRIILQKESGTNFTSGFIAAKKNITVKVEPNIVLRGSVFQPEMHSLCQNARELFECNVNIQNLSFADQYGGKICAALDRQHPRDLFDMKLLFENEGLTKKIRKAFIVYLISHPRPIAELLRPHIKDIREVFENEFQGMTSEMITLDELVSVREQLINIITESLTVDERMFILSFKDMKPKWELLGIEHIQELPAIKWKLINLNLMDSKKHKKALEKLRFYLGI